MREGDESHAKIPAVAVMSKTTWSKKRVGIDNSIWYLVVGS